MITWALFTLETVPHVPDVFHGTTVIGTETVHSARKRLTVLCSRISVVNTVNIQAIRMIITVFTKNSEFRSLQHRVPAHIVTRRGSPLEPLCKQNN